MTDILHSPSVPGGDEAGGAHTPGPWEVAGQYVRTPFVVGIGGGFMIADVGHGVWSAEEHAANARLIAAAPCMLAALEPDFMDAVGAVLDANGCHATAGSVRNYAATQRAAIAKATQPAKSHQEGEGA